jgi:hypothetical protein
MSRSQEKDITAASVFTDKLDVADGHRASVSVSDTYVGTVALQRSFDSGTTWLTVSTWTDEEIETTYVCDEDCHIRLGVTAYTSGTATCRVGTG